MRRTATLLSIVALASAVGAPSSGFAQVANVNTMPEISVRSEFLQLVPVPPLRPSELFAASQNFLRPSQLEPYGVVDQNNVRNTIYRDPMHCPMARLLTPGQMDAAFQACSDTFYHVDHSG